MNWARAREALIFLVIFVAGVLAALLIGWVLTQVQAVRNPRATPPSTQNRLAAEPNGSWTIGLVRPDPFAVTAPGLVERANERRSGPPHAPCASVLSPLSVAPRCGPNALDR